jgi:hypothetical protein
MNDQFTIRSGQISGSVGTPATELPPASFHPADFETDSGSAFPCAF